jgi:hypothetical protein
MASRPCEMTLGFGNLQDQSMGARILSPRLTAAERPRFSLGERGEWGDWPVKSSCMSRFLNRLMVNSAPALG